MTRESVPADERRVRREQEELAHYFRFDELYKERRYVVRRHAVRRGPTGEPILIDYGAVLPMRPNPKASRTTPPGSELRAL